MTCNDNNLFDMFMGCENDFEKNSELLNTNT